MDVKRAQVSQREFWKKWKLKRYTTGIYLAGEEHGSKSQRKEDWNPVIYCCWCSIIYERNSCGKEFRLWCWVEMRELLWIEMPPVQLLKAVEEIYLASTIVSQLWYEIWGALQRVISKLVSRVSVYFNPCWIFRQKRYEKWVRNATSPVWGQ